MSSSSGPMDPLIHGPQLFSEPVAEPSIAELSLAAPHELETSSPLRDFSELLIHPRRFFERFAESEKTAVSAFVMGKAVVGLFIAIWVGELVRQSKLVPKTAFAFWQRLDPGLLSYIQDRLGLPTLKSQWMGLWVAFSQVKAMLSPLFTLFDVVLWCASVLLVLPLLMNGRLRTYSLHTLFTVGCFIEWLHLLGPIPFIGDLVVSLVIPIYFILALKWIYKISFVNALVASELLTWSLALAGVVIVMIGVFAWSFSF